MFTDQRREEILKILSQADSISVNELANILSVSPVTIRSDLNYLNDRNLLIRTHGGAISIKETEERSIDKDYDSRKKKNLAQKNEIAHVAINYIKNGDCIVLDASSTCYELAQLIYQAELKLTIVTNGLRTANLLKENPNLTVIVIGGIAKGNSNALEGLLGVDMLYKISINRAFVSSNAVSLADGLLDFSLYEVELKKKIVETALETYLLVDSSKFEKRSIASFASISQIKCLISDHKLSHEIVSSYSQYVDIHLAPQKN